LKQFTVLAETASLGSEFHRFYNFSGTEIFFRKSYFDLSFASRRWRRLWLIVEPLNIASAVECFQGLLACWLLTWWCLELRR